MYTHDRAILETAQQFNIQITRVDKEIAERLRTKFGKYLQQRADRTRCKIQQVNAWMLIKHYVHDSKAILLYHSIDTSTMFEINNGEELEIIPNEVPYTPAYVTCERGNYLLEVGEYDDLIAYEDAIPWLKEYAAKQN